MPRPLKEGLDYFPHDTDAVNDEKIEALRALYGNDGYTFYFVLLERIYRAPAAELDVSAAETHQILAQKVGVPVELFEKILKTALERGCFDRTQYADRGVLTSNGIKRRAGIVFEKRDQMRQRYEPKSVPGAVVSDAETLPETRVSSLVSDAETPHVDEVSAAKTPPETGVSSPISDAETTQKPDKGKERKGKERGGEERRVEQGRRSPAPPSPDMERITRVEDKLRELRGYDAPSFAAERKTIKAMLRTYEPEEICACYVDLKRDPFWASLPLPMMSLAKQIGEWHANINKQGDKEGQPREGGYLGEHGWGATGQPTAEDLERFGRGELAFTEWFTKQKRDIALQNGHLPPPDVIRSLIVRLQWPDPAFPELAAKVKALVREDEEYTRVLASLTPLQRQIITEPLPGEPGYGEGEGET